MRVLITGGGGQVGTALSQALAPEHEVIAPTSASLDITRRSAPDLVAAARPEIVIHSAAWTDVDGCARDPNRALTVNSLGTWHIVLACQRLDIPLVYISTNEVFDGTATEPYLEWDEPHPINPYARSKHVGEQYVLALLQRFYLVRVAWVFGGERNFVRTILRLASERERLTVVDDEIGNPTFAGDIAAAIRSLIAEPAYGIFHLVNEGHCSRFEFAREILRQAKTEHVTVEPIKLRDYRRASTPPPFTPLRNFAAATSLGITLPPWEDALGRYLRSQHGSA